MKRSTFFFCLTGMATLIPAGAQTMAAPLSPRRTATVELAARAEPAVVAIYAQADGVAHSGSGSVISPRGFILTNDHVVRNRTGVVLFSDGSVLPFRVVGRAPEKDLAIVAVSVKKPLQTLVMGRSHDVLSGEPILVVGNPGGRGIVFSSGIVSSPRMMLDAPNALVMAQFPNDTRDRFIQFDAASNPGNSGGPLINAEGVQIGVVSASDKVSQNINYAIPIDRLHEWLPRMVAPEAKGNFFIGIECDPLATRAVVTRVVPGSPAAGIGVCPGDVLVKAGDVELSRAWDWPLSLVGGRAGTKLPLVWEHQGTRKEATLTVAPYPAMAAVAVAQTRPGLRFAIHPLEKPVRLPDFSTLKPSRQGIAESLDPRSLEPQLSSFGLVLEGFVDLQQDEWCRLIVESDDGSRVFLHGERILDNDGPHPPRESGAVIRATRGLHPIRIEFFELSGGSMLKLYLESADGTRRELEKDALRHAP